MTAVADRSAWWRFVDWCAAADRTPLPAGPETVLAYLAEEGPAGSTAARWVAAIRTVHRQAGWPDPCGGPVTVWVRQARAGTVADPAAVSAAVAEQARRLPTCGWPAGMFGRRDRLAFLLYRLGPIAARRLTQLAAVEVAVAGHGTVTVADTPVRALVDDPAVCPACALLRWHQILERVAANRDLADPLRRATPSPGHICTTATIPPVLDGWPLFPAIDRWGNLPTDPVPAVSVRAMETLLRDVGRQEWRHPALPTPATPTTRNEPTPTAAGTPPLRPAQQHTDGLAARARARQSLDGISGRFDELEAGVDDLAARVDRLLADEQR